MDNFNLYSEFCSVWRSLYYNYLGMGTKAILVDTLQNQIKNLNFKGMYKGFTFATYMECQKSNSQSMLQLLRRPIILQRPWHMSVLLSS